MSLLLILAFAASPVQQNWSVLEADFGRHTFNCRAETKAVFEVYIEIISEKRYLDYSVNKDYFRLVYYDKDGNVVSDKKRAVTMGRPSDRTEVFENSVKLFENKNDPNIFRVESKRIAGDKVVGFEIIMRPDPRGGYSANFIENNRGLVTQGKCVEVPSPK
jgi:hypothetical protein